VSDAAGWRATLGVGTPALTERWLWRLVGVLGFSVVMQGAGYAVGGTGGLLVGVFGSIFFATVLIVMWSLVVYARSAQRKIATLVGGGAIAHWVYTPADLARWTALEERYVAKVRDRRVWLVIGGVGVVGALAVLLADGFSLVTLLTIVFVALVLVGAVGLIRVTARRQIRVNDLPHVDRGAPEVYIGSAGLYQPGPRPAFAPLSWFTMKLDTIGTERDDLLVIVFTQHYTTANRYGAYRQTNIVRVAVPAGQEDEAARIVQQLEAVATDAR